MARARQNTHEQATGRYIGIRPRVKTTDKGGKERPTEACIVDERGRETIYKLPDEQAEMLFIFGRFPVRFEPPTEDVDLASIPNAFLKLENVGKDEEVEPQLVRQVARKKCKIVGVACEFDGMREGDTFAIAAGGLLGNMIAFAAARQATEVGAKVLRLNTSILKQRRGKESREDDHKLLAHLVRDESNIFHTTRPAERQIIKLCMLYDEWLDAMKARIAVGQRVARAERSGTYAVLTADALLDVHEQEKRRADNPNLAAITTEEERAEKALIKFVSDMDLYQQVFKPVPGIGEKIAVRIIASIGDIRRFIVEPDEERMAELYAESMEYKRAGNFAEHQHLIREGVEPNIYFRLRRIAQECDRKGLREDARNLFAAATAEYKRAQRRIKARRATIEKCIHYVGLHLNEDGTFPKNTGGKPSSWSGDGRQGFYLLGDQFAIYQAKSDWGQYLKAMKKHFREVHPEPQRAENNFLLYGEGHITDMARWRTLTRFARKLFEAWLDYYRREGLI